MLGSKLSLAVIIQKQNHRASPSCAICKAGINDSRQSPPLSNPGQLHMQEEAYSTCSHGLPPQQLDKVVPPNEAQDGVCRLKPVKRVLLYWLDGEVFNLPHMTDVCNESDNLAKRDSLLNTAVLDYCSKETAELVYNNHLLSILHFSLLNIPTQHILQTLSLLRRA